MNGPVGIFARLLLCLFSVSAAVAQNPNLFQGISVAAPASPVQPGYHAYEVDVTVNPGQILDYVFLNLESYPASAFSCKLGADVAALGVYIHDDQGNALPSMSISQPVQQHNTQCDLDATSSNITLSGQTYRVIFNIALDSPQYDAPRNIWVTAYDHSCVGGNNVCNTGWLYEGAFSVNGPVPAISTVSVSPASGVSRQDGIQIFSTKIRDTSGAIGIWHVELLWGQGSAWTFGYNIQPNARCKVVAETSAGLLWLEAGPAVNQQVNPPGYVPLGSGPISNGRCTLYPKLSSIEQLDEDTLVVNFAVAFPQAFDGILQDHMFVTDTHGTAHWDTNSANGGSDPIWGWDVFTGNGSLSPDDFINCVSNTQDPRTTCTLAGNTDNGVPIPWLVSNQITCPRSGITINGNVAESVLQRDAGYVGPTPLLLISGSGVTIQGITFDGNRNGVGTYDPNATASNASLNSRCQSCTDLTVQGGEGIHITNSAFLNSPSYGLYIYNPSPGVTMSDVSVASSLFENSHRVGVLVRGLGPAGDDFHNLGPNYWNYRECSGDSDYATGVPAHVSISGNTFRLHSTGAIAFNEAYRSYITGNVFTDNRTNPDEGDNAGGTIFLSPCTNHIQISQNSLAAPNVATPGAVGFELDGMDLIVTNNVISQQPGAAISAQGVSCMSLYDVPGYTPSANSGVNRSEAATRNPSFGLFATGGIFINNVGLFNGIPIRPNDSVTVTNTTSEGNASGIAFASYDNSNITNISVSQNCLDLNALGPIHYQGTIGSGSTISVGANSCPATAGNSGPRSCSQFPF